MGQPTEPDQPRDTPQDAPEGARTDGPTPETAAEDAATGGVETVGAETVDATGGRAAAEDAADEPGEAGHAQQAGAADAQPEPASAAPDDTAAADDAVTSDESAASDDAGAADDAAASDDGRAPQAVGAREDGTDAAEDGLAPGSADPAEVATQDATTGDTVGGSDAPQAVAEPGAVAHDGAGDAHADVAGTANADATSGATFGDTVDGGTATGDTAPGDTAVGDAAEPAQAEPEAVAAPEAAAPVEAATAPEAEPAGAAAEAAASYSTADGATGSATTAGDPTAGDPTAGGPTAGGPTAGDLTPGGAAVDAATLDAATPADPTGPAATPTDGADAPTDGADAPTASAPTQQPGAEAEDDTPYVPRVFAFDPTVSAVVGAVSGDDAASAPGSDADVAPEQPMAAGAAGTEVVPPTAEPSRAAASTDAAGEPTGDPSAPTAAATSAALASAGEPVTPASEPAAPSGDSATPTSDSATPTSDAAASSGAAALSGTTVPFDSAAPSDTATPSGDAAAPTEPAAPSTQPSVSGSDPDVPAAAGPALGVGPTGATSGDDAPTRVFAPVSPAPADPAGDRTEVLPPVAPWERPAVPARPVAGGPVPGAAGGDPVPPAVVAGAFGPVPPDEERVTSPFDGFEEDAPRRGWARGLLWTGIGVLVVGGLYTGAQWYFSDKVPSGTTVAGVDVGGMTRTAAQDELESTLGPRAAEPVTLTAGDATTTLDPAAAGLTLDAAATAEELTSFSMSPTRLWEHLVGGAEKPPVVAVDQEAFDAQVEALHGSLDVEPVDGTVQFVDGAPTATPASDGASLVTDAAAEAILAGWLVTDGPIPLETEAVAPEITQEETDAALAEAETVVSAPVVVAVGGQSPELPEDVLAENGSYAAADGELALTFDGAGLVDAIVDRTNDLLTTADDAHFVFSGGAPVIEGGEPGTTIDPGALVEAVRTAATGDDREASVELVESDPEQSVAALEELGVKEKISEFSTPLTSEPVRTENLRVGASKVNGTLVLPGETFSLTETLSPITAAGGYFSAGIVQDGKHVEGVGGGLSQMATTAYNAGFFAGLEDVEHRQHSYWFTRYPAGREATIFVGSLDMRFKNDTPYGVLLQSWVGGGELHVAVWSTKYYEVETSASEKTNVVQPTTVTHTGADCVPQPAGNAGFSITNYRKVYLDGDLVKDEADHWTYRPDNQVVCE